MSDTPKAPDWKKQIEDMEPNIKDIKKAEQKKKRKEKRKKDEDDAKNGINRFRDWSLRGKKY